MISTLTIPEMEQPVPFHQAKLIAQLITVVNLTRDPP